MASAVYLVADLLIFGYVWFLWPHKNRVLLKGSPSANYDHIQTDIQ